MGSGSGVGGQGGSGGGRVIKLPSCTVLHVDPLRWGSELLGEEWEGVGRGKGGGRQAASLTGSGGRVDGWWWGRGPSLHSSHRCLTEKIFSQLEKEKGGKNKVSLRGAVSRRRRCGTPPPG